MMVDANFRAATVDDTAELTWLEDIARSALVGQRGGNLWLEDHAAQSPGWPAIANEDVLVSTIDDVVVGYLRLNVRGPVVDVEEVFVHPDAREIGCGEGLLSAAIDVGRRRGAHRVRGSALPGDRETKNLYERAAITAVLITVSAPIQPAI